MEKYRTVNISFLRSLSLDELLKSYDYFISQMKDRYIRIDGENEMNITPENKIIYDRCKDILSKIDEVLLDKFLDQ